MMSKTRKVNTKIAKCLYILVMRSIITYASSILLVWKNQRDNGNQQSTYKSSKDSTHGYIISFSHYPSSNNRNIFKPSAPIAPVQKRGQNGAVQQTDGIVDQSSRNFKSGLVEEICNDKTLGILLSDTEYCLIPNYIISKENSKYSSILTNLRQTWEGHPEFLNPKQNWILV